MGCSSPLKNRNLKSLYHRGHRGHRGFRTKRKKEKYEQPSCGLSVEKLF
jgi:hypothetical protein